MEDCLRLSKGRLTKSGSEAEEKGVGCRAKKCTVLFSPGSSPSKKKQKVAGKVASSCLKSKLKLNFPKPPATDKTDFLQKETRKAFTSSNTNVQGSNQTPKQPKKSTPTSKPQMNVKTSKTDTENREAFPELDSIPIRASKPQMNSQTPKTHKESKEASQEVVSTPLRAIEALLVDVSRDVKKLKATVSVMQADLKSLIEIEKLRGVPNVINANALDEFPFSSVDKLIEFDDKLKANPQLCQQVVHALYKKVDKTSLAKTARDVIRITLTPSLYNSFNFKGKGDRNKNAWAELNMYNLVQKSVVTKKWGDSDQVVTLMNTTCSDFLVQEAGKYLKKQNLCTMENNNNRIIYQMKQLIDNYISTEEARQESPRIQPQSTSSISTLDRPAPQIQSRSQPSDSRSQTIYMPSSSGSRRQNNSSINAVVDAKFEPYKTDFRAKKRKSSKAAKPAEFKISKVILLPVPSCYTLNKSQRNFIASCKLYRDNVEFTSVTGIQIPATCLFF
nr:PREDICTED: uncharacterized protein LOC109031087 [Bemisia tabaci]